MAEALRTCAIRCCTITSSLREFVVSFAAALLLAWAWMSDFSWLLDSASGREPKSMRIHGSIHHSNEPRSGGFCSERVPTCSGLP